MAKLRLIKNLGTGFRKVERWKNWKRTAKNGITKPKKDKKEWKDLFKEREKKKKKTWKEKDLFLNGNTLFSVPIPANFCERTSTA